MPYLWFSQTPELDRILEFASLNRESLWFRFNYGAASSYPIKSQLFRSGAVFGPASRFDFCKGSLVPLIPWTGLVYWISFMGWLISVVPCKIGSLAAPSRDLAMRRYTSRLVTRTKEFNNPASRRSFHDPRRSEGNSQHSVIRKSSTL